MAKRDEIFPSLGDHLARLTEDDLDNWSAHLMDEITDEHVKALQEAGWKIVSNDGLSHWPFDSEATGCSCPNWCDDLSPKKPTAPNQKA